jgi:hypothetical protein
MSRYKFTIAFDTDNDAFGNPDDVPAIHTADKLAESSRILQRIASRVEDGQTFGAVLDTNGNTVGEWALQNVVEGSFL